MKIRDAIRLVEKDGWHLVGQEDSHRQYKHPAKKGRVTIAGHPSLDLDPKTQSSYPGASGVEIRRSFRADRHRLQRARPGSSRLRRGGIYARRNYRTDPPRDWASPCRDAGGRGSHPRSQNDRRVHRGRLRLLAPQARAADAESNDRGSFWRPRYAPAGHGGRQAAISGEAAAPREWDHSS
jgi:predicted RNA binding protein YcfA (HicA-like mRNA interferase family)